MWWDRMDKEFSDYKKLGIHLNQMMGSSSSIGAKRVSNVCVAFRAASEQNNRAGYYYYFFPSPFSSLFSSFHIRTKKIIFLYQNLEYFWNKKLPQYLNSEWIESINPQLAFVGFVNGVLFGCYIFSGAWEL